MVIQKWIRVPWKPKQIKGIKPGSQINIAPFPTTGTPHKKYNVIWVIHFTGYCSCCRGRYKQLAYRRWSCRKRLCTNLYFFWGGDHWSFSAVIKGGWKNNVMAIHFDMVQNVNGNTIIDPCPSISICKCLFCHSNEHVCQKVAVKNLKKNK